MIITSYIHPPIPVRHFDWVAYIDGLEENTKLYGHGASEQAARDDLRAQLDLYDREDLIRENFPLELDFPA